jgi:sulfopropanediol 3-dehydrogenase
LVCFSEEFAKAVMSSIDRQLLSLATRSVAQVSWQNNGRIYIAEHADEAIAIADDYAPEHLELHVSDRAYYVDRLCNYGSLFIGEETTVAYGDKSIGTNHILPTSRAARYTGGLWVGKFLKTVTYQHMTPQASKEIGLVTERQCNAERMIAHGITAKVRVDCFSNE